MLRTIYLRCVDLLNISRFTQMNIEAPASQVQNSVKFAERNFHVRTQVFARRAGPQSDPNLVQTGLKFLRCNLGCLAIVAILALLQVELQMTQVPHQVPRLQIHPAEARLQTVMLLTLPVVQPKMGLVVVAVAVVEVEAAEVVLQIYPLDHKITILTLDSLSMRVQCINTRTLSPSSR